MSDLQPRFFHVDYKSHGEPKLRLLTLMPEPGEIITEFDIANAINSYNPPFPVDPDSVTWYEIDAATYFKESFELQATRPTHHTLRRRPTLNRMN